MSNKNIDFSFKEYFFFYLFFVQIEKKYFFKNKLCYFFKQYIVISTKIF